MYSTRDLVAERFNASTRYKTLKEFTTIHGVGPSKARELYHEGCRSLEDLDRVYGSDRDSITTGPPRWTGEISGIRTALELRNDLRQTLVFCFCFLLITTVANSRQASLVRKLSRLMLSLELNWSYWKGAVYVLQWEGEVFILTHAPLDPCKSILLDTGEESKNATTSILFYRIPN